MEKTKTMEYIEILFPNKEKRREFLSLSSLTFKVRLDVLEEVLGIDKQILLNELTDNNQKYEKSMKYLFFHSPKNQRVAKERFVDFLNRLVNAAKENNKEKISEIMSEIYDKKAKIFKDNHVLNQDYNDEEIRTLVVYQLKYGLNNKALARIFNVGFTNYGKKVKQYFINHPEDGELKSEYEFLGDYNNKKYMENRYDGGIKSGRF